MEKGSQDLDAAIRQDEQAVAKVINRFSDGICGLDADLVSSVFHPEAASFSLTPRGICIEPFDNWPKIIEQAKADSAHLFQEQFSIEILRIDVVGTVAAAKVMWTFESIIIVDFYNMIKMEGEWLIVNQVYFTSNLANAK